MLNCFACVERFCRGIRLPRIVAPLHGRQTEWILQQWIIAIIVFNNHIKIISGGVKQLHTGLPSLGSGMRALAINIGIGKLCAHGEIFAAPFTVQCLACKPGITRN